MGYHSSPYSSPYYKKVLTVKMKPILVLVAISLAAGMFILWRLLPDSSSLPSEDSAVAAEDSGMDLASPSQRQEGTPFDRVTRALPSVAGFELRSSGQESASSLAAEIRDPDWAIATEARIMDAIGDLESLQVTRIEIECRATSCGILLVHAPDADRELMFGIRRIRERLPEILDFAGSDGVTSFGKNGDFSAIYLVGATGIEAVN
jgi:hypothetical protein